MKVITYNNSCSDDVLRCIAKYCPRLETLNIARSLDVTNDGIKYFCPLKTKGKGLAKTVPCPLLTNIGLKDTKVHQGGIVQLLKNLPSLRKIKYSELPVLIYAMHKNDLGSLAEAKTYNLTHLNLIALISFLYAHIYDDTLKICCTLCPKLKYLYFPVLKLEHLNLCSTLIDIEDVALHCEEESNIDISDFLQQKGDKLKSLSLFKGTVSLSTLSQCCPRLNCLQLVRSSILYDDADSASAFENLKELYVQDMDLSDSGNNKGISHILRSSPLLEDLSFAYLFDITFTPEMKRDILGSCKQGTLKHIAFGFTIDDDFLNRILASCSTLDTLNYYDCYPSREQEADLYRIAATVPNRPQVLISTF